MSLKICLSPTYTKITLLPLTFHLGHHSPTDSFMTYCMLMLLISHWIYMYADVLALTKEWEQETQEVIERWEICNGIERIDSERIGRNEVEGKWEEVQTQCQIGKGVNAILRIECNKCCNFRCSRLKRIRGVQNVQCPSCRKGNNRDRWRP